MSKETFADYLRRVGADQMDAGREYTAADYDAAARRIDALTEALREIKELCYAPGRIDKTAILSTAQAALKNS